MSPAPPGPTGDGALPFSEGFVMTSSPSTGGANNRARRVVLLRMNVSIHVGCFNFERLGAEGEAS